MFSAVCCAVPRVTGGWGYQMNMLNSLVPDALIAPLTGVVVLGVSSAVLVAALSVAILFESRCAIRRRTVAAGGQSVYACRFLYAHHPRSTTCLTISPRAARAWNMSA